MNNLPAVTIIIVNYNGKHFLEECISSLEKLNYPKDKYNVVFVDNNSSDDSVEFVRNKFSWVKIICNKTNLGFAAGNNIAFRNCNADYLVTLNNDTKVTSHWLMELVKPAVQDPLVGLAGGKTLFLNNPNVVQVKSLMPCYSGRAVQLGFAETNIDENSVRYIFGPSGVAALYKREMLEDIGMFDEDYFAYYEDVDICWRAQLAGWKAVYCSEALVYHHHSGSFKYASPQQRFFVVRNRLWTALKNWPFQVLLKYLPWIVFFHTAQALWCIIFKRDLSYFSAFYSFIKGFNIMLTKRAIIKRKPAIDISNFFIPLHQELLLIMRGLIKKGLQIYENSIGD